MQLLKQWSANEKQKVSEQTQVRMLRAIRKIKMVMDVDAMTSMYTQYLFQEKQGVYLENVVKDLQTSLSQLTNTAEIPKVSTLVQTSEPSQLSNIPTSMT